MNRPGGNCYPACFMENHMQIRHLKDIKAVILDMDGVLWREKEPIGDLPAIFDQFNSAGLKVLLATNNGTRTPDQYLSKFKEFGVKLDKEQIITSAMGAAYLLQHKFPDKGNIYVVGEIGVVEAVTDAGFSISEHEACAVVAGMDRLISFDKLRTACLLIRGGAAFYGTNPDRTFPTPAGLIPGAGAILSALETSTDVHPIIAGKPNPTLFEFAMQRLQVSPEQTLVIGDRLDTDILGGVNAGCKTALVLTGISTFEDATHYEVNPDLILPALENLLKE